LAKLFNHKIKRFFICILIAVLLFVSIKLVVKIIYPIDYENYIKKYSQNYNIDSHLVAAIINVESKYDTFAMSKKDARGLMQISPNTGKWASEKIDIQDFTLESLYDPEINIRIGCWYLSVLADEFNGNLQLILAAYNGGSGNVNKWLKDDRYSKDGKSLDYIPFKETSDYVEKVLKNYEMYKKIYKNTFDMESSSRYDFKKDMKNKFIKMFENYIDV
jgi:soluble lytic murein transglycosylase